ncbi:hypothetical protein GCM10009810_26620 [Nostocoides vanveenii]|uniref:Luciferase-like domain-containing protein n=1 Tax=Nostocoides vanveenii TaxID=330835 RepID=A0ABN2KV69_9MICO
MDPTTGRTSTEHERIKAHVEIAKKADEAGLDVVAFGQHHNPPFVASAPTTMAYVAAQTSRILLSTSTTLITTTDPVRIAEDYGTLQLLTDGRRDLMLGRGNTGPVYPWLAGVHGHATAVGRHTAICLARLDSQPGDRGAGRLLRRRLLRQPRLLAGVAHPADGAALPGAL